VKAIGVSRVTLTRIETGKVSPNFETLKLFLDFFKSDPVELMKCFVKITPPLDEKRLISLGIKKKKGSHNG